MEYDLRLGEPLDVMLEDRQCVSNLQEITPEGTMILSAPTFRTAPVILKAGERMTLIYYRASGMYSCVVEVTRRFTEKAVPFVEVEMRSRVTKYQRRDFVRFETVLPVSLVQIASAEKVKGSSAEAAWKAVFDWRYVGMPRPGLSEPIQGMTMDISGGGARISSAAAFEPEALVECTFTLDDAEKVTVDTRVLRCETAPSEQHQYQMGVTFIGIEEKIRKRIIRYIFDEQVKRRAKTEA